MTSASLRPPRPTRKAASRSRTQLRSQLLFQKRQWQNRFFSQPWAILGRVHAAAGLSTMCVGTVARWALVLLSGAIGVSVAGNASHARHLVVHVHGISGFGSDLGYLQRRLESEGSVVVLACSRNEGGWKTFDGIVPGGLRVAREVREFASALPSLETISFVGNSLGGLYTRQALGTLYDDSTGRIAGLRPLALVTTAAPHLGSRRTLWGPLLRPLAAVAPRAISGSGRDVFELSPVLEAMSSDETFLAPLRSFRLRRAYGTARGDFMVPMDSALFTSLSATALERIGSPLDARDAPRGGRAVLIPSGATSTVAGEPLPDGEARLAEALETVGFDRVLVTFARTGPLNVPLAHNKLVALERRPEDIRASLFKGLEDTAVGQPVIDGLARWLLAALRREGES